jgi:hypothetical protein
MSLGLTLVTRITSDFEPIAPNVASFWICG